MHGKLDDVWMVLNLHSNFQELLSQPQHKHTIENLYFLLHHHPYAKFIGNLSSVSTDEISNLFSGADILKQFNDWQEIVKQLQNSSVLSTYLSEIMVHEFYHYNK